MRWLALAQIIGGPCRLTANNGQIVSDRDFRGKYLLIYFGYTSCPNVGPTALKDVAAALDRLGLRASQSQPLFVTVGPKRDTLPVIARYVAVFTPRLIGLTNWPSEIAR